MSTTISRRFLGRALLGAWGLHTLSACSSPAVQLLTGRSISMSHEQLQSTLERRFPLEQRVADVLSVRLSAPRLRLLPETGRIATELRLDITERLLRTSHPASLALDYGLRFEPSDRTVRLRDVRVQQLAFTRLAPAYQELMNRYAPRLAERALNDQVLHQVSEADWNSLQLLGLQPTEFKVTPQALVLEFRPPAPASAR